MDVAQTEHASRVRYLQRDEGRIAYTVSGDGPLVVAAPGMGDLRSIYRFTLPALVTAGYRVAALDLRGHGDSDATFTSYDDVAALDLRGHGDSDATFTSYDDVATGTDLIALTRSLAGSAVLVGNSMSAGAAVWAAAEAPDLIAGLVLIGPFVRNAPVGLIPRLAFRLALIRPWGAAAWNAYYAKLYPGRRPNDLASHRAQIRASLRRPGHWQAFAATTHTSHAPAEARLAEVHIPTLVIMSDHDPDFPDPDAEARFVADQLGGEILMVPSAGHYPQAEFPELTTPRLLSFLDRVFGRGPFQIRRHCHAATGSR